MLEDVVPGADVVVTGTTGETPVLGNELIEDGMHIAALGGGLAGTQELDVAILRRSRIIVDDMRQCITDGEINVPLTKGELQESDVAGDIGEVITGKIPGPHLGERGHAVRFDRDRASGFRDSPAGI